MKSKGAEWGNEGAVGRASVDSGMSSVMSVMSNCGKLLGRLLGEGET